MTYNHTNILLLSSISVQYFTKGAYPAIPVAPSPDSLSLNKLVEPHRASGVYRQLLRERSCFGLPCSCNSDLIRLKEVECFQPDRGRRHANLRFRKQLMSDIIEPNLGDSCKPRVRLAVRYPQ